MAQLDDFNKMIMGGNEISKVLHQCKVIWRRGLDLSDPSLWEQGGLAASTGAEVTTTTRIRTKDYYEIESDSIKLKAVSPYTVNLTYFKADGTFVSHGQRGSDFTESIPLGATKFRPSIATTPNNANITVNEAVNANIRITFLD